MEEIAIVWALATFRSMGSIIRKLTADNARDNLQIPIGFFVFLNSGIVI